MHSEWVQPTPFNVWAQAKAPCQFLFPHLKECRGAQVRCLHPMCGWIYSHCSRGPSSVYGRSHIMAGKLVCRFETWQSHSSQGRHLSREEEDQLQIGGLAAWGCTSDCNGHPLIQSERSAQTFTCPTSQLASPHCIRNCCSLMHGCPSSMGWMYQPHPSHTYCQMEWQQDNATRRQWSGDHPASG